MRTTLAATVARIVPMFFLGLSVAITRVQAEPMLSVGRQFQEVGGEAIFRASCQACHMAQGQGVVGAGRYPPLAGNPRLSNVDYPIAVVLHGQGGMPPFAKLLSDEQIAQVLTYVRSHFGNQFTDTVTTARVKMLSH